MRPHRHTRTRVACTGSSFLTRLTLQGQVYFSPVTALPQPPVQGTPHPHPPPLQAMLLLMDLEGRVGSSLPTVKA